MSCACGHHQSQQEHNSDIPGIPVNLKRPLIGLTGKLTCAGTDDLMLSLALLPEHVRLSCAEPGCLRFDIWQTDDPMVWQLSELFVDEAAFAAHQSRTQASEWGQNSADIKRDFQKQELTPVIREQNATDTEAILHLMEGELLLADKLRNSQGKGVLSSSLVAESASVLLGYIGLQENKIIGPFIHDKLNAPEIAQTLQQEIMRRAK